MTADELKDALIDELNNVNVLLFAVEKTDCGHPSCLDRAMELSNRIRSRRKAPDALFPAHTAQRTTEGK